jgi:hypothetical protein
VHGGLLTGSDAQISHLKKVSKIIIQGFAATLKKGVPDCQKGTIYGNPNRICTSQIRRLTTLTNGIQQGVD